MPSGRPVILDHIVELSDRCIVAAKTCIVKNIQGRVTGAVLAEMKYKMEEAEDGATGSALALQIQRQYEEEDRQLRSQMQQLIDSTPATFDCGICMDTFSEDVVARIELCGHSFCR